MWVGVKCNVGRGFLRISGFQHPLAMALAMAMAMALALEVAMVDLEVLVVKILEAVKGIAAKAGLTGPSCLGNASHYSQSCLGWLGEKSHLR